MAPPGRWRTLGVDSESSTLTEVWFLALMGERGTGMRASSCPLDPVAAPTPGGPLGLQQACCSHLMEILARAAELELGCQEEGRGRRRHPRPTILQHSCLRQDLLEATVTGLLKPERSPGYQRGYRIKGATGGPHTCSSLTPKAQNRSSVSRMTRSPTRRVRQRPGGAMLYASRLRTLMH